MIKLESKQAWGPGAFTLFGAVVFPKVGHESESITPARLSYSLIFSVLEGVQSLVLASSNVQDAYRMQYFPIKQAKKSQVS